MGTEVEADAATELGISRLRLRVGRADSCLDGDGEGEGRDDCFSEMRACIWDLQASKDLYCSFLSREREGTNTSNTLALRGCPRSCLFRRVSA